MTLLPDEKELLKEEMMRICDNNLAEVIFTTGGTGLSSRDCMPEATEEVGERRVPGIPEAMRQYLWLSPKRCYPAHACGTRKNTLILNLPGSPKAVRECLEYVIQDLIHGLEIMVGEANNCARK